MTPKAIEEAARILAEARHGGVLLDALPESCRPTTLDDAHAIQLATIAGLHEAIGGYKVGAAPDGGVAHGAVLRSRLVASGATLAASSVPLLGVEAEIAFQFARAMPARERAYSYDEVSDAVTAMVAIEVVDSRFRGYPNAAFLDRVADCMSNGALVHGELRPDWRAFDLSQLDAELAFDGSTIVRRIGGHPNVDPLLPAVALVNDLRSGAGVKAGQIVTTGSYTGLNHAKPGQSVVATFHGFGFVQVQFSA